MKTTNSTKTPLWVSAAILAIPFFYLAYIWKDLPARVAVHYDLEGRPNGYGSPIEFFFMLLLVSSLGLGLTWLFNNIHKIDPKRAANSASLMRKISLLITFFLSGIMTYVIYTPTAQTFASPRFVFVAVPLLLAFIGNFMNNVKPNYFVGMRTPWTLENETVWRKTHHFSSKLWFFGGLIMALMELILPLVPAIVAMVSGILVLTIVPAVYSYRVYKQEKALK